MGLFQSLNVGVLGLQAQANKLSVVSDNVSNVNTVGYKGNIAQFNTLVSNFAGGNYLAGGVKPGFQQTNQKGGVITGTDSSTDLAISGKGFFPVSDVSAAGGTIFYTRAGSFTTNSNGDYLNSGGYFLQGWRLDENGELPTALNSATITESEAIAALETINIANLTLEAVPTSIISLQANLKAAEVTLPNSSIDYVGNLSSAQTAAATATVGVETNLLSSDTIYGSFEFQIEELYQRVQSLSQSNRQDIMASVTALFPSAPTNLLINQTALEDFVSAQYGSSVTSVQTFLDAVQPSLAPGNQFANYQSSPITYNATSQLANMASGVVPSNYRKALTVYDSAGVQRSIYISYLKTADNSWAVEIYAARDDEMTPAVGFPPGLIASGNITFDTTGALASIDAALTSALSVSWNTPTATSALTFDFGAVGTTDGLAESTNSYSSVFDTQPTYDPDVSASSMSSGAITPHYSTASTITDSDGVVRNVTLNFLKTGDNLWAVEITANPTSDISTPTNGVAGQIAFGTVSFNGDDTFEQRVGRLVDAVFSTAQTTAQKTQAAQAMNFVLGSTVITIVPDLDSPAVIKDKLITALQVPPYPVAPDALEIFVANVQAPAAGLSATNPLKTYQVPVGPNGALKTISGSLSSPITVNWATATEPNTLQFDWGTLGQKDGLKQISTGFTGTPTVTRNYSAIDPTLNMASGTISPNFSRPIDIIDSDGELHTLNFNFLKTGANTWSVEIAIEDSSEITPASNLITNGIITFNGDGTLNSITTSLSDPIDVAWTSGATSSITLDLGTAGPIAGTVGATVVGLNDGLTQLTDDYKTRAVSQNGSVPGENASITVDENGVLVGRYENGSVRRLYKIPLAEFISPDKLQAVSNNVFLESQNSGDATFFQAGQSQDTVIQGNALETSNVDLAAELSNMLIAQRAYQSNSKLISTTDNLLETLKDM